MDNNEDDPIPRPDPFVHIPTDLEIVAEAAEHLSGVSDHFKIFAERIRRQIKSRAEAVAEQEELYADFAAEVSDPNA